jgi:hypothetical protein
VLLFFSASPGKRGIYLTPALPAVILAAAPYLNSLYSRRGVQRTGLVLSGALVIATLALLAGHMAGAKWALKVPASLGVSSMMPFVVLAVLGAGAWLCAWRTRPILAWAGVMTSVMLVWSYGVNPQIDGERSAQTFVRGMLSQVPANAELAFMGYKEQFLLYLDRPIVNFGHRRWLEGPKESYDAAQWLNGGGERVLLMPADQLKPCFSDSPYRVGGVASGEQWLLVSRPASTACADQGNRHNTIHYQPPATR